LGLSALVLVAGVIPLPAQVFQVGVGSSSQFHAHGGSVGIFSRKYTSGVGVGTLEGLKFGAFLRTQIRGTTLMFGDDAIPFRLPTDVFDSSHYYLGRGVGISKVRDRFTVYGFAGTTTLGYGTPFFRAAQSEKGVGVIFMDGQLTPTLRAFSRTVFSDRQTAINGVEWQPRTDLRAALAAGLGANRGYFSSSLTADREWISVKAAYVRASDEFRRTTATQPLGSEVDRENVFVTVRPTSFLRVGAGRQNFLQPSNRGLPGMRGSVNQYLATAVAGGFQMGANVFDSRVSGNRSLASSVFLGREIAGRVSAHANILHTHLAHGPSMTTFVATVREIISPRLSLLQVVSRSAGQTSMSYGGELVSNRLTVGVEYQTLYVPFQIGNQFKQALVLNIRLQPFGNFRAHVGTFVAPDGKVQYTASLGSFLYRGALSGTRPAVMAIYRNVIRGRVTDPEGCPIRGAALRIDGHMTFTDSRGEFFVRMRRPGSYRLEVALAEFLTPGHYEVLSAPTTVGTAPEDRALPVRIVLQRINGAPQ